MTGILRRRGQTGGHTEDPRENPEAGEKQRRERGGQRLPAASGSWGRSKPVLPGAPGEHPTSGPGRKHSLSF